MRPRGDSDSDMSTMFMTEDLVEALIKGDAVPAAYDPLARFAAEVRALGDGPAPAPSPDLATLLAGGRLLRPLPATPPGRPSGPGARRQASRLGKVAGLGLAAKLGLGATVVAAGVAGAGAAGVLPAPADHVVRHAIEAVTPVRFAPGKDHPDNFGSRVSSDATGKSDGTNGVNGQDISSQAPGAAHRSTDSARPGEPPGQSGITGKARADQTPAGTNQSKTTPTTDPTHGRSTAPGQANGATASAQGQAQRVPTTDPNRGG